MQNIRVQIRTARPLYGAQFRVDSDLVEFGLIGERCKNTLEPNKASDIDDAFQAVLKAQADLTTIQRLDVDNFVKHNAPHGYSRGAIFSSGSSCCVRCQLLISSD
jgi:hypothetical protein